MKVSVIIPTLNAEKEITLLLNKLLEQTIQSEIIVIDSASDDKTQVLVRKYGDPVKLVCIPREEFNHGGTRDSALRSSTGEYVLFFSQDAIPTDSRYIEKLLTVFEDDTIAAVFGRQIAYSDAPEYEKLIRQFNYPQESRTWSKEDIQELGIKAYFFSDVCSAYRRSAYLEAGGFDSPIETNEDMLMAAKLLHSGYRLAYNADAQVFHSHHFTLFQEYRRSALSAQIMKRYEKYLTREKCDYEGKRLVRHVFTSLLKDGRFGQAVVFIIHAGVRLIGDRCGKHRRSKI